MLIQIQKKWEELSVEEQSEYKVCYHKIVQMLDRVDNFIHKTNDLRIY